MVVHATGLGKTDIIAKLATDEAAAGGLVLLVAHRSEPLDQMTQRCLMHAPAIPVGRAQAGRNEIDRRIIVASVQTICRDARLAQLPKPTMLIIDECHHALSASYHKVMKHCGSFDAKGTRTLGVTATLIRGDHRGFGGLFTSVADERDIDWAVDNGWLVRPHGCAVVLDRLRLLDRVMVRNGDFAGNELGALITQDAEHIVKAWQNNGENRITAGQTALSTQHCQRRRELRRDVHRIGVGVREQHQHDQPVRARQIRGQHRAFDVETGCHEMSPASRCTVAPLSGGLTPITAADTTSGPCPGGYPAHG